MSVGRPLAKEEEKKDSLAVSSPCFFQVPPLTEMCMDILLSKEHEMECRVDEQSLGGLYDAYKQFKQKKLKSLLEAILWGDPKTTLDMIDKYPVLLLEKLEDQLTLNGVEVEGEIAVAPSGHKTTNTTAYRVALAVEDTELAAKIKAKLIALAGEEAAEAQGREQFPRGWEAAEKKALEPILKQLERLAQAIRDAAPGDIVSSGAPQQQLTVREGSKVAHALAQFRSLLDSKVDEIMTTGRQFSPQLFLHALEMYDDCYRNGYFGAYNNPCALLFWQRVIGYIQRSLPANYIQALIESLSTAADKLQKGVPQNRSLKSGVYDKFGEYDHDRAIPIYPLSNSHLGLDFALFGQRCVSSGDGVAGVFLKFMKIKNSRKAELMPHKSALESWCPVM